MGNKKKRKRRITVEMLNAVAFLNEFVNDLIHLKKLEKK